jgi:hypothetical protein
MATARLVFQHVNREANGQTRVMVESPRNWPDKITGRYVRHLIVGNNSHDAREPPIAHRLVDDRITLHHLERKYRPLLAINTAVSELSGMATAQTSGPQTPAAASITPTTL